MRAVAANYPSSDFLNFGRETSLPERISGEQRIREILRECSPATHVSADDPPFLLFHGDGDQLIPIQQSRRFAALPARAGVEHRLVVKAGQGHGWEPDAAERAEFRGWFGRHTAARGGKTGLASRGELAYPRSIRDSEPERGNVCRKSGSWW